MDVDDDDDATIDSFALTNLSGFVPFGGGENKTGESIHGTLYGGMYSYSYSYRTLPYLNYGTITAAIPNVTCCSCGTLRYGTLVHTHRYLRSCLW